MSYIVHGGPLAWALTAAVAALVLAAIRFTYKHWHHGPRLPLEWAQGHQAARHARGHQTPGGDVSPRAAAGSVVPGGGDAGDFPAGRAPRDWGESRLPSAAERTAELAAIATSRQPPWDPAPEGDWDEKPEPPDDEYMGLHAAPDVPQAAECGPDHQWDDLYRDEFQPQPRGMTDWAESDRALCLCGKVPDIPGEPITSEADCPAHGNPPADSTMFGGPPSEPEPPTVTDVRAVPAAVADREHAASRWQLKAHVSHTMARKSPLREYVDQQVGPPVTELNPAYAADITDLSPAEDFDRILAEVRAGGSDG